MPAFVEGTPAEYGYGPISGQALPIATNGTIPGTFGVVRVTTTGNVTGVILSPPGAGPRNYDEIVVINESANTITFAAAGSNVADGSTSAIPANSSRRFSWDGNTGLWYRAA